MSDRPRRVLIVGWDGAGWDALQPWIDAGRLPILAELQSRGAWGPLRSTAPPVTPAAWTSMATGLRPGRTGVLGFRHLDLRHPSGYCPELASSADLQGSTLFEHAIAQGEGVSLVGWPMTWPPFPLPGGVLLSGWPRPASRRPPVWPAAEGRRLGPWGEDLGGTPRGLPTPEEEIARAAWFDRRHAEIAERWLRTRQDRLVAVVFSGFDHLAHRLWGDPRLAEHAERLDRHLGTLLEAAGPECGLLLVSDHGFGPAPTRRIHLERWLEQQGWATRLQNTGAAGGLAGRLRGAVPAPAWRQLRRHLPANLKRSAYERARGIGGLDLPATRAVRVPLHEGWDGVHLLVQGRTGGGVLAPDAAPEALDRLERALRSAALPSGRPLVFSVDRSAPAPGLESRVPDLIVDYGADAAGGDGHGEGPLEEPVPSAELRRFPGGHRRAGLALLAGPGLRPAPWPAAGVADAVATGLAWLGASVPDDLDGAVWQDLLVGPTRYGPSTRRARGGARPGREVDPAELARLGYLVD